MKDYFKELNIIDILGIGVPGCLLLLLLGGDRTGELLWMSQFHNHPLAFGVMLIAAGSLAGMLIQELGDMIEKGLWLASWLDPKVYAAHTVNTSTLSQAQLKKLKDHKISIREGFAANCMILLASAAAVLMIFCACGLLPFVMWRALPDGVDGWFRFAPFWGLLPLIVTGLVALGLRSKLPARKDTSGNPNSEWETIVLLRCANPYIQTCLVDHGNASKRTLFDGWRFVMRNLILVLGVANLISLWRPLDLYRRVAESLVGANGCMNGNLFALTLLASCAVSLMLVRYYHYAYLRYKYSLENFMYLGQNNNP